MHHKFIVVDFNKPSARVWFGSHNFSSAADTKNGENLVLIRNRHVATAFAIEALRMFDHYHFRVLRTKAQAKGDKLVLRLAPTNDTDKPWWDEYYTVPRKIRDRELFA